MLLAQPHVRVDTEHKKKIARKYGRPATIAGAVEFVPSPVESQPLRSRLPPSLPCRPFRIFRAFHSPNHPSYSSRSGTNVQKKRQRRRGPVGLGCGGVQSREPRTSLSSRGNRAVVKRALEERERVEQHSSGGRKSSVRGARVILPIWRVLWRTRSRQRNAGIWPRSFCSRGNTRRLCDFSRRA